MRKSPVSRVVTHQKSQDTRSLLKSSSSLCPTPVTVVYAATTQKQWLSGRPGPGKGGWQVPQVVFFWLFLPQKPAENLEACRSQRIAFWSRPSFI